MAQVDRLQARERRSRNGADECAFGRLLFRAADADARRDRVTDVGDAGSATAAQPSFDTHCASQTSRFGGEPPTQRTATVCSGHGSSRFVFSAPKSGRFFRLRRTFDAGLAGQAAEVLANGTKVGAWPDVQTNPTRRWSQLDINFVLAQPASELSFEIRPIAGRVVTKSSYELWGAVQSDSRLQRTR